MNIFREKAAHFYYKNLTGAIEDWIEEQSNGLDIDSDVVDLANLLHEIYKQGYDEGFNAAETHFNLVQGF